MYTKSISVISELLSGQQWNVAVMYAIELQGSKKLQVCKSVLALDPSHPRANFKCASALRQLRRQSEALLHYRRHLEHYPADEQVQPLPQLEGIILTHMSDVPASLHQCHSQLHTQLAVVFYQCLSGRAAQPRSLSRYHVNVNDLLVIHVLAASCSCLCAGFPYGYWHSHALLHAATQAHL